MKKRTKVCILIFIILFIGVICYFYNVLYQYGIQLSIIVYNNRDWLFSGAGLVLITWIVSRMVKIIQKFFKMHKTFSDRKKNTTVTFLFGNGFDISVGMKSSYIDFLSWYENQLTHSS